MPISEFDISFSYVKRRTNNVNENYFD